MSKYAELKREFESFNQHDLTPYDGDPGLMPVSIRSEGLFRFWLLRLLFEIHGDLDSLAADYKRLVKMQEQRQK